VPLYYPDDIQLRSDTNPGTITCTARTVLKDPKGMKPRYRTCCFGFTLLIVLPLAACTLKLTTDLSKIIGIDNPSELMQSEEAQQIATRIGEGMGTKIMEGEILAEDMGKGVGEVLLKPQLVPLIQNPISVELIEANGREAMQQGDYSTAISAFKRTNNLARIEEIALILFDEGATDEAADLHHYLTERGWPLRPPYFLAKHIEDEGLAVINNPAFKEINPEQYNRTYTRRHYNLLDTMSLEESYLSNNTITKNEMLRQLRGIPLIILADAYFVVKQHTCFVDILTSLNHDNLIIGLEEELYKLKKNREIADKLNYLPLFTFVENNGIPTFTHGPPPEAITGTTPAVIDFFSWDTMVADKTAELLHQGKQVIIIIGDTHVSPDHLPFLIEEKVGINPTLVVQNPLHISLEEILEGKKLVCTEELEAWGVNEEKALKIDNDFYLNTEIPAQDLKHYIEMFNLEPSLRKKGT
jgi:hypothetical protein